jgi:hypothetical protein
MFCVTVRRWDTTICFRHNLLCALPFVLHPVRLALIDLFSKEMQCDGDAPSRLSAVSHHDISFVFKPTRIRLRVYEHLTNRHPLQRMQNVLHTLEVQSIRDLQYKCMYGQGLRCYAGWLLNLNPHTSVCSLTLEPKHRFEIIQQGNTASLIVLMPL